MSVKEVSSCDGAHFSFDVEVALITVDDEILRRHVANVFPGGDLAHVSQSYHFRYVSGIEMELHAIR